MIEYDPYAPDPDEDWRYNTGRTAVPKDAPAPTAPWTDPDNAPPAWLYDGNQQPVTDPGPGNYWAFDGTMWVIRTAPRAPKPPQMTTPEASPLPTGDYTPPGGYGGDGGYQAPERRPLRALNYPQFNAERMGAPTPFSYDPFAYESFQAPTIGEAQQEPGFDYALQQGIKAYENSKAYLGTYKSGGTIKGLNDYARNMANQNYSQVFDRKAQTYDRNRGNAYGQWSANRDNAADAYATNYGISRDVFDRNYTAAKDEYAPKARSSELEFARDWDQYAYEGDDEYRRWKAQIDANTP
jgi:hypothetical protein